MRKYGLLFLEILLCISFITLSIIGSSIKAILANYNKSLGSQSKIELNMNNVMHHVQILSSFSSRVPGYPDTLNVVNYLVKELNKYNLNVTLQSFKVAMPIDEGSYVKVNNLVLKAYALWPNGIQTCSTPSGEISGKLIYVGHGTFNEIRGKDVKGAIALMEFNSGMNWLNLMKLGAKGVIFIEPIYTDMYESLKKAIPVPVYFPRLYVNGSVGLKLKELADKGIEAKIYIGMKWKQVTAWNILAKLPGSEFTNEVIVISTNYDSWSIVPALAPGGGDTLSIGILLELARVFAENRPKRTLWFLFHTSYYQAQTGIIEWVERYLFSPEVQNGTLKILFHIDLDISSESKSLDVLYTSPPLWFGDIDQFAARFSWFETTVVNNLDRALRDLIRFNFASMRWGTQPVLRDTDWYYWPAVQPVLQTGILGVTLRTQWTRRLRWFTPLNDVRYINWKNVSYQLKVISSIVNTLANTPEWGLDYVTPTRMSLAPSVGWLMLGFITLEGRVAEFNVSSGWYSPVGNLLVRAYYGDPNSYLIWFFSSRYNFSDSEGRFIFHGLVPYQTCSFDAWGFDRNGRICYAVDYGIYGTATQLSGGISTHVYAISHPSSVMIPVFKCVEATIYDLLDPNIMRRCQTYFSSTNPTLSVYEYGTDSLPTFFSTYFAPSYDVGMVFVKPGSRVIVTFNPFIGRRSRPALIFTNSSEDYPEGYGYVLNHPLTIGGILEASKDMYHMVKYRYSLLASRNIRNPSIEELIREAELLIFNASKSYSHFIYDKATSYAWLSLTMLLRAYDQVMSSINEVAIFIAFFAIPTILFAISFERLILHRQGIRRILGIIAILFLAFTFLNYITPAFTILQNSAMVIIGIGLLLLTFFIIGVFARDIQDLMERGLIEVFGEHLVKGERVTAILHTVGVAIENMRKRPLVTVLSLITIICFTAAQTAFTSASYMISIASSSMKGQIPYEGILLKRQYGFFPETTRGGGLDLPLISYYLKMFNETFIVAPRVWYYPTSLYPYGVSTLFISQKGLSKFISPVALLGLTDEELGILLKDHIISGSLSLANDGCIVSKTLASELNLTIGDKLYISSLNINLTVRGIMLITQDDLRDFDGEYIIPIDPSYSTEISRMEIPFTEEAYPMPISVDNFIIIPWKIAYKFGGYISSVALIPRHKSSQDDLVKIGRQLALSLDIPVYVGYDNTVTLLSRTITYAISGWELMSVILILSILSIINVFLSNVQQRRREIYVYASLGLSPMSAALMFIVEAITYAALGVSLGYILGYCLDNLLLYTVPEISSELSFNITSVFIVFSLLSIFIACIVSAIYPSLIASKIITPSLERRWKPPTKPKRNIWEMPLPFKVASKAEALGVLKFLAEYYSGLGSVKRWFNVLSVGKIDYNKLEFEMEVMLLPPELNIVQKVTVQAITGDGKTYEFIVIVERLRGDYNQWKNRNYYFFDDLRKQLLLWRTLPPETQRKYLT